MKRFVLSILCFAWVLCFAHLGQAKVELLAKTNGTVASGSNSSNDSGDTCASQGYHRTALDCNGVLLEPCSGNSTYYKFCCPTGYKYTKEQCGDKIRSTDNCHGYYKCD
jgi:hypothetical protein